MNISVRSTVAPLLLAAGVLGLAGEAPAADPPKPAEVGAKAPDFTLTDTDGKEHRLSQYTAEGKTVVLEWFNPNCPFVRRHHEKEKTMERLFDANKGKGVVWLAINSGAPGNQGAGRERNIKAKQDLKLEYPILLDEAGAVGRMYGAKTTPNMFVINKDGVLVYAGAIDDNPRGSKENPTNYVGLALGACMSGQPVATARTDSYGCSVKYGAAPSM